jgi:hypothetical protein
MKAKDRTGHRFGLLVAREYRGTMIIGGYKTAAWYCECDCGGNGVFSAYMLQKGNRKSCGCARYTGARKGTDGASVDKERRSVNVDLEWKTGDQNQDREDRIRAASADRYRSARGNADQSDQ